MVGGKEAIKASSVADPSKAPTRLGQQHPFRKEPSMGTFLIFKFEKPSSTFSSFFSSIADPVGQRGHLTRGGSARLELFSSRVIHGSYFSGPQS